MPMERLEITAPPQAAGRLDAWLVTQCEQLSRSALQNAASVAAMVLTTESLVSEQPKEEPAAPAAGGMGGMY